MKGTAPIYFMTETLSKPEAMQICDLVDTQISLLKDLLEHPKNSDVDEVSIKGEIRVLKSAKRKMEGRK